MNARALAPGIACLHRLAWQPGASMHAHWWQRLSLEHWGDVYRHAPSCRRAIDATIVASRGFPSAPLSASLAPRDQALIGLAPRWRRFITALGVVALDCPDHLLLGTHREALAAWLNDQDCEQLLAIHGKWNAGAAPVAADRLAQAAYEAGTRWWVRDADSNMTCRLLATLLPPLEAGDSTPDANAADCIIRISRFL
jgi:hypothetical protein